MTYILVLTLILSSGSNVTSQKVATVEECHEKGKQWLIEKLGSVNELDFAITYTCNPDEEK